MSIHNPRVSYDFTAAITNLSNKIQELSSIKQQQQGSPGILSSGLRYWRLNKANIVFLFTMYSMSTAAVLAAWMSESRLQSDQHMEEQEQQQLQQSIDRLRRQSQQHQQIIDTLRTQVEQHHSSWWGNNKFRQQLLQQIRDWRLQEQQQEQEVFGDDETLKQSRKRAKGDPRAEEQFGVRVGKLGQGFII